MFMWTCYYNGFAVGSILALLELSFDQKIMIFRIGDISAGSTDKDAKMLVKVVYNLFELACII